MNSIDFTPLYRSSVGFDRLASLINSAMSAESASTGYPPYNIEVVEDNRYSITLAVAGFSQSDLDIQVEKGVLTVSGKKDNKTERDYLYQGIADRAFERKFNLADFVEVRGASLKDGILTIDLVKEIPEEMKPRTIEISDDSRAKAIEHQKDKAA